MAQSLRAARHDVRPRLTPQLRAETPDWLLERLDTALRAIELASGEVGRFIREDRAGYTAPPVREDGEEDQAVRRSLNR